MDFENETSGGSKETPMANLDENQKLHEELNIVEYEDPFMMDDTHFSSPGPGFVFEDSGVDESSGTNYSSTDSSWQLNLATLGGKMDGGDGDFKIIPGGDLHHSKSNDVADNLGSFDDGGDGDFKTIHSIVPASYPPSSAIESEDFENEISKGSDPMEEVGTERRGYGSPNRRFHLCLIFLILVGFVVAIAIPISRGNDDSPGSGSIVDPTPSPSIMLEYPILLNFTIRQSWLLSGVNETLTETQSNALSETVEKEIMSLVPEEVQSVIVDVVSQDIISTNTSELISVESLRKRNFRNGGRKLFRTEIERFLQQFNITALGLVLDAEFEILCEPSQCDAIISSIASSLNLTEIYLDSMNQVGINVGSPNVVDTEVLIQQLSPEPSHLPTTAITAKWPSSNPTYGATKDPTTVTDKPTHLITSKVPTYSPSPKVTALPTQLPISKVPTADPTEMPVSATPTTAFPTKSPTTSPTFLPTMEPTASPTKLVPTIGPTIYSANPTFEPITSHKPSSEPIINSVNPTLEPVTSHKPSSDLTSDPTTIPTVVEKTYVPVPSPTGLPTESPSELITSVSDVCYDSTDPRYVDDDGICQKYGYDSFRDASCFDFNHCSEKSYHVALIEMTYGTRDVSGDGMKIETTQFRYGITYNSDRGSKPIASTTWSWLGDCCIVEAEFLGPEWGNDLCNREADTETNECIDYEGEKEDSAACIDGIKMDEGFNVRDGYVQEYGEIMITFAGIVRKSESGVFMSIAVAEDIHCVIQVEGPDCGDNFCSTIQTEPPTSLMFPGDSATEWVKVGQTLYGENANSFFGIAISLSRDGTILAVGAAMDDGKEGDDSGVVRVYEQKQREDGVIWNQIGQDIEGRSPGDSSGVSVSLSADGSIIAIGSHGNDENGNEAGSVRVFQYDKNRWLQLGKDILGEQEYDYFGESVSLSEAGTTIAIGSAWNDGGGTNSGSVRMFEYIERGSVGKWEQKGQSIHGSFANDAFGVAVSISGEGTIVAIGARLSDDDANNGSNSGRVQVFEYDSATKKWNQFGLNTIPGEFANDEFGDVVSLSHNGHIVAVGSEGNDNANGENAGHVRVYRLDSKTLTWKQLGQDIDGEAANDRRVGFITTYVSLSDDGTVVATGSELNDGIGGVDSGSVRIYRYVLDGDKDENEGEWVQISQDIDGENPSDLFGGSLSISGDGTTVAAGAIGSDGGPDRESSGEGPFGSVRAFRF